MDQSQYQIAQAMYDAAQRLIEMVQRRMNDRVRILQELNVTPMDNIPDAVKEMREVEAVKLRAVIQEQMDLIDTMKIIFPKPTAQSTPPGDHKQIT